MTLLISRVGTAGAIGSSAVKLMATSFAAGALSVCSLLVSSVLGPAGSGSVLDVILLLDSAVVVGGSEDNEVTSEAVFGVSMTCSCVALADPVSSPMTVAVPDILSTEVFTLAVGGSVS